jgi:hypothetical protein
MKKSSALTTATFADLVTLIQQTHEELTVQASKAVNVSLTLRNWLIGLHIAEYEQAGQDRADYGAALLAKLSIELRQKKVPRCDERELRRYRQFYQTYPQIRESLTPELVSRIPHLTNSGVADSRIQTASAESSAISAKTLISCLSFTHIAELLRLDNPQQRAFY